MTRWKSTFCFLIAAGIIAVVGTCVYSRPDGRGRELLNVLVEPGSGQLQEGRAEIRLREQFGSQTRKCEYTTHVTPRDGKAKGYLYVEEITATHLVVVESGGGKSDARFDYLVVATQWTQGDNETSQPQ